MRNFLQKHGKWILAILSTVLILTFGPRFGNNNTDVQGKIVRGTLSGKNVTNADLGDAKNDIYVLSKLNEFLFPTFVQANLTQAQLMPYVRLRSFLMGTLNQEQGDLHYYLLMTEARKFGLAATADDIHTLEQGLHLDAETIGKFDNGSGIQYPMLTQALGSYVLINKLEDLAMGALQPSLPEVEYLADQSLSTAKIRYVIFNAQNPMPLAEPSQAAIDAQVAAYKSILPPSVTRQEPAVINGHDYPFGYKYPDRVKVEYLAFVRDDIIKTIQPGPKDWEAALAYYTNNQAEFTDKPATDTTGPQPLPRVKTFNDVKDQLMRRQIEIAADKRMDEMVKWAQASTSAPWKEIDDLGYRKTIDRGRWVSYGTVADAIKTKYGYRPQVISPEEWLDVNGLHALPGIGNAVYINDNKRVADFATAALHVKELDDNPAAPWMRALQVGVDGPVMYDLAEVNSQQRRKNNAFIYRVDAASKSHEPAGELEMAEVAAHAKADLLRVATLQKYQQRGEALAQEAAKTSLETVARKNELTTSETSLGRLGMYLEPVEIPELGVMPKFADAVFTLAAHSSLAPPATQGAGSSTAPATAPKPGPAVAAIPIDAVLKVVLVQVDDYHPIAANMLDPTFVRMHYVDLARSPKEQAFRAHWTSPEAVAKRLSFEPHVPFKANKGAS